MKKPIHIRKIAEDVDIDKIWWREGENGLKVARRLAKELEEFLDGELEVMTYSSIKKRQHEYYLTVDKDSLL